MSFIQTVFFCFARIKSLNTDSSLFTLYTRCFFTAASECSSSHLSIENASCSPVHGRHSRRFQLNPRRMVPSARNEPLVPQRLCGLASCSVGSVKNSQELEYRTSAIALPQSLPPPFQLLLLPHCLLPLSPPSRTVVLTTTRKAAAENKISGHGCLKCRNSFAVRRSIRDARWSAKRWLQIRRPCLIEVILNLRRISNLNILERRSGATVHYSCRIKYLCQHWHCD